MGFGLPLLWHHFSKLRSTLIFCLPFFALIEFLQHFVGRSTDIDDLILNLTGVVVGFGLYTLLTKFISLKHLRR
mgnify:CR=1 FL=1